MNWRATADWLTIERLVHLCLVHLLFVVCMPPLSGSFLEILTVENDPLFKVIAISAAINFYPLIKAAAHHYTVFLSFMTLLPHVIFSGFLMNTLVRGSVAFLSEAWPTNRMRKSCYTVQRLSGHKRDRFPLQAGVWGGGSPIYLAIEAAMLNHCRSFTVFPCRRSPTGPLFCICFSYQVCGRGRFSQGNN